SAAARPLDPGAVLLIPAQGLGQTARPCFEWPPTNLPLNLARVDSVTPIVSGSILDVTNQRQGFTKGGQDRLDDLEIAARVSRPNVIYRAAFPFVEHVQYSPAVIVHIDPV